MAGLPGGAAGAPPSRSRASSLVSRLTAPACKEPSQGSGGSSAAAEAVCRQVVLGGGRGTGRK